MPTDNLRKKAAITPEKQAVRKRWSQLLKNFFVAGKNVGHGLEKIERVGKGAWPHALQRLATRERGMMDKMV